MKDEDNIDEKFLYESNYPYAAFCSQCNNYGVEKCSNCTYYREFVSTGEYYE